MLTRIFDENFDSRLVTSSLLGKILSLNIRIIERIQQFTSEETTLNSGFYVYLITETLEFQESLHNSIEDKIRKMLIRVLDT